MTAIALRFGAAALVLAGCARPSLPDQVARCERLLVQGDHEALSEHLASLPDVQPREEQGLEWRIAKLRVLADAGLGRTDRVQAWFDHVSETLGRAPSFELHGRVVVALVEARTNGTEICEVADRVRREFPDRFEEIRDYLWNGLLPLDLCWRWRPACTY